jgi:uncharacterized protein YndB with AHSA1/START domain
MGKRPRTVGTCVFCGTFGLLTKEDFTPRWLGRLFDSQFRTGNNWELDSISFGGDRDYHSGTRQVRSASAIKPIVVCASCNNGWMSVLEKSASRLITPMIFGQSIALEVADLGVVAAWAMKTALIFEFVGEDGSQDDTTASAHDRSLFRQSRRPLTTSRVWMARYCGSRPMYMARSTLLTYDLDDPTSIPAPHGLLVTLAYGQLALRVGLVRSAPTLPTRFAVAEPSGCSAIWPATSQLTWPAADAIDDDGLTSFGVVHLPDVGPGSLSAYGPPRRSD